MKEKNNIISIDLTKSKNFSMLKTPNKLGMERIYEKPIANILNGKKLKVFPLRSGTGHGCLFLPLLFNILLKVLIRIIRQEKETKYIQFRKEVKLYLQMT